MRSPASLATIAVAALALAGPAPAQPLSMVVIGDSTGEGVQSGDAQAITQRMTYGAFFARKAGIDFPLPLIRGTPFSDVFSVDGRERIDPTVEGHNLAVSGAKLGDVLRNRANALTVADINSETDLVLFPRTGSQVEIAEAMSPDLVLVWIGNNDALAAVTSFDRLNASQLTSPDAFHRDYRELADRLVATGANVIFANLPDPTSIGYLFSPEDLVTFTGSDHGLPAGHHTSLVAALLLRLGLETSELLQNPDWVLDPTELATIQARIALFNEIIAAEAARVGMPVAPIAETLAAFAANPLRIGNLEISTRYLGGIVSLDGVHPSSIAHMILANQFIGIANDSFGLAIPRIGVLELLLGLFTDPHVDKDGDLRVRGRPLAGLLETLAPLVGISGDRNDLVPDPAAASAMTREDVVRLFRSRR